MFPKNIHFFDPGLFLDLNLTLPPRRGPTHSRVELWLLNKKQERVTPTRSLDSKLSQFGVISALERLSE